MTTLVKLSIEDYIKEHTITDKEKIRIALSMPKHVPDSFIERKLIPVGIAKFKGDKIRIEAWSVDKHFTIGEYYPIYDSEGEFAISVKTGEGMKITPKAWSIKYF